VAWTSRGQKSEYFKVVSETVASKAIPSWLNLDITNMSGRVLTLPEVEEIGAKFNPSTIVEYYSR
jgi:small subunit ribosomal protein S4